MSNTSAISSANIRTVGWAMCGALALTACGSNTNTAEEPRDARRVTLSTANVGDVVASNSAFAWSLYDQARIKPGNLFFSPFSISTALSMTLLGARGQTADEMRTVLHVTNDASYHTALGALFTDLAGDHPGRGYELYAANALFGQQGYDFSPAFIANNGKIYGAPLTDVDFEGSTEQARATINGWVSDQTHAEIAELLQPATIDSTTRLVLTNAIYFQAHWEIAFDPNKTSQADFHLESGETRSVPMMWTHGEFRHAETATMIGIELPYADDEVSMVLVRPQTQTLAELEPTLSSAIDSVINGVQESLDVSVPRFQLDQRLPLKEELIALGMPTAFEGTADFSGMVASAPAGLFLKDTVHEGTVTVDESGTRAAAATAVVVGKHAAAMPVVFDRPFAFAIRDRLTGSILFIGRVTTL